MEGTKTIDGSWQRCASQSACFNNPNWQIIYYIDLPQGSQYAFDSGFFEDGEFLWYSQDPNPSDPFYYDRYENLRIIPKNDPQILQTQTSITDPRYFTQTDPNFWNGAYIIIWASPNGMYIRKVTGYNPATHTLNFEIVSNDFYTDRDSYYSVLNHISMIDTPGEYSFDETLQRLYVWPRGSNIGAHTYGLQDLQTGIYATSAKNINIDGFVIRNYTFGIRSIEIGNGPPENVTIRNNDVRNLKSNDWYAIRVGGKNVTVSGNTVFQSLRGVGIIGGGDNITIKNNSVTKATRQGIWIMGGNGSQILNNTVISCKGVHANGISVYSAGSTIDTLNSVVAGNCVSDSNAAFTFDYFNNLSAYNNVFLGDNTGNYVVANWGGMAGTVNFSNDVVLYSENHCSVLLTQGDAATYTFQNNIVDGGGDGLRTNNIYVGLCWPQDMNHGWQLGPGEVVETDLNKIFVDPQSRNYRPRPNGPAIDTGADLSSLFSSDILGVSRPQGSAWDIGAYEYVPGSDITAPARPSGLTVK